MTRNLTGNVDPSVSVCDKGISTIGAQTHAVDGARVASRRRALHGASALAILLASMLSAAPVRAQTALSDPTPAEAAADAIHQPAADTRADTIEKLARSKPLPSGDDDIIVTGSLIPIENGILPVPTVSLTARDIESRGFTSVAEAIQQSPFSTGNVQGASSGYSQGARTTRLFGFGPGFTKYLLDGRPMGMFPALYGSQTAIIDLSVIPTQLVERVDILPGGQSSLYGSDAIAGVVNIILKKTLDAPIVDARLGLNDRGGGRSWRVSGADSVTKGPATILFGGQYEDIQPIWDFQRRLTSTPFRDGTSPPVPDQIASVYDAYTYQAVDIPAARCAGLSSLFGGGVAYYDDPTAGSYCGNYNTGYSTLANKERRVNLYAHGTLDLHEDISLYADILYGKANNQYTYALNSSFYDSSFANSPIFIDSLGAPVFLVRGFSPEEFGGTDDLLSRQRTKTLFTNLGLRGTIGNTRWNYDLTYTHNEQSLSLRRRAIFAAPVERYFASLLGPRTGTYDDPYYGTLTRYADLPNLFSPIPANDIASFYGFATSRAKTSSNWGRALTSNGHLFALPGGDAGIALAIEGGNERWNYTPDAGFSNDTYYGYVTDVSGNGKRSYVAWTGEVRLPILPFATLSGSLRYDRYYASGNQTGRASYNIAGEVIPFSMLTLRARYGTAFKAPTLADLYQGESSQFGYALDLARCVQAAGSIAGLTNCQIGGFYTLRLSGNTALRPITANVADLGAVFEPVRNVSLSVDYLRWHVDNGVSQEDPGRILRDEALCLLNSDQVDAARCAAVRSYVTRDSFGAISAVYGPKVNITRARRGSLVTSLSASHDFGAFGEFSLSAAYTLLIENKVQATPQSMVFNLLANPLTSSDFRTRANASLGWTLDRIGANIYVDRVGRTPNFIARTQGVDAEGAGRVSPLTLINLALQYRLTPSIRLSGNVNNLFDSDPPTDRSYPGTVTGAYNDFNYNVIGRSYLLQVSVGL